MHVLRAERCKRYTAILNVALHKNETLMTAPGLLTFR